jgi:hypothetical protein
MAHHLPLSSVVKALDGRLVIRNDIYRRAIGEPWLETKLRLHGGFAARLRRALG